MTATLVPIRCTWEINASVEYDVSGKPDVPRSGLPAIRPERLFIIWRNNELVQVSVSGYRLSPMNGKPTRRQVTEWWIPDEVTGVYDPAMIMIPAPDWVQDIVRATKMPTSLKDVKTTEDCHEDV